jgi:hypothetical protein
MNKSLVIIFPSDIQWEIINDFRYLKDDIFIMPWIDRDKEFWRSKVYKFFERKKRIWEEVV